MLYFVICIQYCVFCAHKIERSSQLDSDTINDTVYSHRERIDTPCSFGYIFEKDFKVENFPDKQTERFTPNENDVKTAEEIIQKNLRMCAENQLGTMPEFFKRLPHYIRQYFGLIENGEKVVLVNFIPDNFVTEQTAGQAVHFPMEIDDKYHDDFWQIYGFVMKVNLSDESIYDFKFLDF